MRIKALFPILCVLILLLTSCSQSENSNSEAEKLPYDTCKAIQEDIEREFPSGGSDLMPMKVYVSDAGNGNSISVHMSWEGMPLEVEFPDYVNAGILCSKRVSKKYDVAVGDLQITFTRGENEILNWHSKDGETGFLFDSYGSKRNSFQNQTVEDLVRRYGAMNWFYDLSWVLVPDHLTKYLSEATDPSLVETPSDQYVMDCLVGIDTIKGFAPVTKEHDPNGGLGAEGGYLGCVYFSDERVSETGGSDLTPDEIIDNATKGGGAIEVFPSQEEANIRDAKLKRSGKAVGSHYVLGTVVIRTSELLSGAEQSDLTETIARALLQIDSDN